MNNTAQTVNRVAWSIRQRADAQNWKGKKADALAIEAACGALAATIALMGEEAPETQALSLFAFNVSTRGLAYVQDRAKLHAEEPAA